MSNNSIQQIYDPYMVLLSLLIAYVGSYLAICLSEQYRQFVVSTRTVQELGTDVEDSTSGVDEHHLHAAHNLHFGEVPVMTRTGRFLFSNNSTQEFVFLVSASYILLANELMFDFVGDS
jgi:hypothetical protein